MTDAVVVIGRMSVDETGSPLAVTRRRPHFSWAFESEERDLRQESYRVTVRPAGSSETLWDSGVVAGDRSLGVVYDGPALPAATRFEWTVDAVIGGVAVRGRDAFETGPADEAWAGAEWITIPRAKALHEDRRPTPYLRRTFSLDERPVRARLYATAGGIHQPWLNGGAVSLSTFAPGWTDYSIRVPFHAYDVTDALRAGENTIGAIVGDGWYSGYIGPFNQRDFWGDVPVFRGLLLMEYADREPEWIATDTSWSGAFGAIQASDMIHGEVFDRRLRLGDWSDGAPEGHWVPAVVDVGPAGALVPALIPAAQELRTVSPVGAVEVLPGSWIVDFGQNFAGRVRIEVGGPAGASIRLRHAEILDESGGLYLDNLRGARATDTVFADGGEPFVYEPTFTYHGFRYLEITAPPGCVDPLSATGVVLSGVERLAGGLETDSALVNQLQHNIEWSLISNVFEVPTDCPNRDERLGWGGDAHVFAPTAMFNAPLAPFYRKWNQDNLDAQKPDGAFADIAPGRVVDFAEVGAAGYADAGVFLPWSSYEQYGDVGILEEAFSGMLAWVGYIESRNPDLLWSEQRNSDYGDWLTTEPTDKVLVATAHFARAAQVAAWTAQVLGRTGEQQRLEDLHARIAHAYRAAFLDDDGAEVATQAAFVFALEFGLALPEQRAGVARRLIDHVERSGRLTVGFLAVRYVLPLLCEFGRADLAYAMLFREESPSWGSQIRRGLTTIGEHWDAWQPDGQLVDPAMNSFNHTPLGAVGEWMYRDIGGIASLAPGYSRIRIAPRPGFGINAASCFHDSPHGRIATRWQLEGSTFSLEAEIPPNTTAVVRLPDGTETQVGSGRHRFRAQAVVPAVQQAGTGSGFRPA